MLLQFLAQHADTVTQTGVMSDLGRKCVDLSRVSVWDRAGRKQDSVVNVEAIQLPCAGFETNKQKGNIYIHV